MPLVSLGFSGIWATGVRLVAQWAAPPMVAEAKGDQPSADTPEIEIRL
jgi:hypothetical protein